MIFILRAASEHRTAEPSNWQQRGEERESVSPVQSLGEIEPQPDVKGEFDILVKSIFPGETETARLPKKTGRFDNWLPGTDSNRRQGG